MNSLFETINRLENQNSVEDTEGTPETNQPEKENESEVIDQESEEDRRSRSDDEDPDETTKSQTVSVQAAQVEVWITFHDKELSGEQLQQRRQPRNVKNLQNMFLMLKEIMSAETTPLQKARLNFAMLSSLFSSLISFLENHVPFCSVKVINIPSESLDVQICLLHDW